MSTMEWIATGEIVVWLAAMIACLALLPNMRRNKR